MKQLTNNGHFFLSVGEPEVQGKDWLGSSEPFPNKGFVWDHTCKKMLEALDPPSSYEKTDLVSTHMKSSWLTLIISLRRSRLTQKIHLWLCL